VKGLNETGIIKKINSDVARVENLALAVFEITKDSRVIYKSNRNPRLSVLAIVGPPLLYEEEVYKSLRPEVLSGFKKVLLAEIGVRRGKPYSEANGIGSYRELPCVPGRRKWFYLTEKQYNLAAPQVFCWLFDFACRRANSWKTRDSGRYIPVRKKIYNRRENRWSYISMKEHVSRGTRFSVSPKDKLLAADICLIDRLTQTALRRMQKGGLVRLIDLVLTHLQRKRKIKNWEREVENIFHESKVPFDDKVEAIRNHRDFLPKKYRFKNYNDFFWKQIKAIYDHKKEKVEPEDGDSGLRQRCGDIKLILTADHKKPEKYLVFEIFPKLGEIEFEQELK
jgi:hypothetical protein